MSLATPTSSSTYSIGNRLAEGGYGEVYLAEWHRRGEMRPVAVKLLSAQSGDRDALQRNLEEARLLLRLDHPNIPRLIDLTELDGRAAVVLEYIEGQDASVIGQLPPRAILDAGEQVADALDHALKTESSVLHRDVTPRNIRISSDGRAVLLDFGIAKALVGERPIKTATGFRVGSVDYFAPERFLDAEDLPAGDVYGLGCTMLELSTGQRLIRKDESTPLKVFALHTSEKLRDRIRERVESIEHEPLRELVGHMLSVDPRDRPTAEHVRQRCADLREDAPGPGLTDWAQQNLRQLPTPGSPGSLSGRQIDSSGDAFTLPVPLLDGRGPTRPSVFTAPVKTGLLAGAGVFLALGLGAIGLISGAGLLLLALQLRPMAPAVSEPIEDVEASPAPDPMPEPPAIVAPLPAGGAADAVTEATVQPGRAVSGNEFFGCGAQMALEAEARLGRLSKSQVDCLELGVKDASLKPTDRRTIGQMLLVHAQERCTHSSDCELFEWLLPYFFEEVAKYDPELMLVWAKYLASKGSNADLEQSVVWATRALESRERAPLSRFTAVTLGGHELRTRSAQELWSRSLRGEGETPRTEHWRLETRMYSREWGTQLDSLGRSTVVARQVCASAQGSESWCDQNIGRGDGSLPLTFLSVPLGATVTIDGIVVGKTPLVDQAMSFGEHKVVMERKDETIERTVMVTTGGARKFQWDTRERGDGWRQLAD